MPSGSLVRGRIAFSTAHPTALEFFAGIGLVRLALEHAGFRVVWANDIERAKRDLYVTNFGREDFLLGDVRDVRGDELPEASVATASFPCTDLSLAGNRAGLRGSESGMFWEFARVLREMGDRRPAAALLENVPSFATSHGGGDLRAAVAELNDLGYICDLLIVDARRFVPQSRPRLFIVGSQKALLDGSDFSPSELRPPWVERFIATHSDLRVQALDVSLPVAEARTLADVVQRLRAVDGRWWEPERAGRFVESLSPVQAARLERLKWNQRLTWATAFRRTRHGRAVWEIRRDAISGCLRTARGGSSKQAIVEAGRGVVRVRWMTPREYARLQGAPDYGLGAVSRNQAIFGLGDAVCVPVVAWLAREYLRPLIEGSLTSPQPVAAVA